MFKHSLIVLCALAALLLLPIALNASVPVDDPEEGGGGSGGGSGGGGGSTGGGTTGPQYRISTAVYPIGADFSVPPFIGKTKIRAWTRFEQNIGGNWTKVDADWIGVDCIGSSINDQDDENNAGFVDVEDWSGELNHTNPGIFYPVSCFHHAINNGVTYTETNTICLLAAGAALIPC